LRHSRQRSRKAVLAVSLEQFKNKHKDRVRCFIICPGYTLKGMNLERLKDEITIGVNDVHLACEPLGFHLDYLVHCGDSTQHNYEQMDKQPNMTIFFTAGGELQYTELFKKPPMFIIKTLFQNLRNPDDIGFSDDIEKGAYIVLGVIFPAIQLACYMGFKEVYILGMDCKIINGQRYFNDELYLDSKYKPVDPERFEKLYAPGWANYFMKLYRIVFEQMGKKLVNCSPDSSIVCLPYRKFEEIP
jgi:hypothetical protein